MNDREMFHRNVNQTRVDNRMLLVAKDSSILYVEGDSDIRFYDWLIDNDCVEIQQLHGKKNVLSAIKIDNEQLLSGRLAIVDSDFDKVLGIEQNEENVICTDSHDMETVMLDFCGYKIIERECVDFENSLYFENERIIWDEILTVAKKLGKLRLLSEENNLRIDFKSSEGFMHQYFHKNESGIEFKFDGYMKLLVQKSKKCILSCEEVKTMYYADSRSFDEVTWQICRGHDITLMLSIIYSMDFFGINNPKQNNIESFLRIAFTSSGKFTETKMYGLIKKWEENNPGKRIRCEALRQI